MIKSEEKFPMLESFDIFLYFVLPQRGRGWLKDRDSPRHFLSWRDSRITHGFKKNHEREKRSKRGAEKGGTY
jgi:hypothetical protein